MNCMKCGQETEGSNVFCPECLAIMARYPVSPTVAVQLPPKKRDAPVKKAPRRRSPQSPEELAAALSRRVRWLYAIAAALLVLLVLATVLLVHSLQHKDESKPSIGQNYSTIGETGST